MATKKDNPKKTKNTGTAGSKLAQSVPSELGPDLSTSETDAVPVTIIDNTPSTDDQSLWTAIRNRTLAMGFSQYQKRIDNLFCEDRQGPSLDKVAKALSENHSRRSGNGGAGLFDARLSLKSADAYNVLRLATEVFLLLECGIVEEKDNIIKLKDPQVSGFSADDEAQVSIAESNRYPQTDQLDLGTVEALLARYFNGNAQLPYLRTILINMLGPDEEVWKEKLPYCVGVLQHRFTCPSMIELIWSYWHEEGMLTQSMNAISLRFQNRRRSERDPLANVELDPLRPLNNLIWGHVQSEYNRLTLPRRAYEYDHHYGITLYGKSVPKLKSADSRSTFIKALHNLLLLASEYYREDANMTVRPDAFPLLKSIGEVHLILAEGAHNQFGDLPWAARVEMMIEQWLLSRDEIDEFLRYRPMMPYQEAWMGPVDAMKKLQGWGDVSVTHYHTLATAGEQLLLSLRYGNWTDTSMTEDSAKNWANYWKNEVQRYIHAYRVVTGVDLTKEPVDIMPPWVHLKRKEKMRAAGA